MRKLLFNLALTALMALLLAATANAARVEMELVRPDGIVHIDPINVLAHPKSLDGKTIALKWSSKPNGDIMLNRVAELIAKEYPTAKVIKTWEGQSSGTTGTLGATGSLLVGWSTGKARSVEMAKAMQALKPDLVIGGQGD